MQQEYSSVENHRLFVCANCSRKANSEADNVTFKLCSGCHMVRYCNRECQLEHRKSHKAVCKAVKTSNVNSTVTREDLHNILNYCKKGDLEGLRREIAQGVNFNAASNELQYEAWFSLIQGRFYECAEFLLQHQANPNIKSTERDTLLYVACYCGFEEFVSLLLRYNANSNIVNRNNGYSPLLVACQKGHDSCAAMLLQHNVDPNLVNNVDGYSPLLMACQQGHDTCVSLLLQHDADPNIVNSVDGLAPLYLACLLGHDKCLSLLL